MRPKPTRKRISRAVEEEWTVNKNGTSSGKSQTRFENFERTATLTETERRQRLHRRAGCDCTEEEAMIDPTPEERVEGIDLGDPRVLEEGAVQQSIVYHIRAAVEAERKRCEAEWEQERRDLIGEIQEARTYGGTYQE
jgi:hypothetical protein